MRKETNRVLQTRDWWRSGRYFLKHWVFVLRHLSSCFSFVLNLAWLWKMTS